MRIGDIDVARIGLGTNRHLSLWWTSCREAERADGHPIGLGPDRQIRSLPSRVIRKS